VVSNKSIKRMYKFTFKTEAELNQAESKGFIESYDIVRMVVKITNGTHDFPCKTEEEYYRLLKIYGSKIERVYQDTHCFDIQDYD
jgi:hypothetical protein